MPVTKLVPPSLLGDPRLAQLRQLLPECFAEGEINLEALRQALGVNVADESPSAEHFGLSWPGKKAARRFASQPSKGALWPFPGEGVDEAGTRNIFIEGENLEVLKLLRKAYAKRAKIIYIDPPYNTGSDFVYPDDYTDPLDTYLKRTGQKSAEGEMLTTNPESSGRFHSLWLSMMYPRLRVAFDLLSDDGVIFISIHHRELSRLLQLCDEVFGEENFVAIITWKARVKPVNIGEAKYRPQCETEYVVAYQRSAKEGKFKPLYTGGVRSYPHTLNGRKYRLQTILKSNRGVNFRSTMSFPVRGYTPPEGQRWQGGKEEIHRLDAEGYLEFRDGTPFLRYFEDEEGAEHDPFYCFMETDWSSTSEAGKFELNSLLGDNHGFDTVKPTRLIRTLIQSLTSPEGNDVVIDFFAGSGTTGHAVMAQNAADGGNRQYILVQFPEPLDPEDKNQKTSAAYCDKLSKPCNIAEITKERLRRASAQLSKEWGAAHGSSTPGGAKSKGSAAATPDFGFRCLRLGPSSYKQWADYKGQDLAELQGLFAAHQSPLQDSYDPGALHTEIALLEGFPLDSVQEAQKRYAKNTVIEVSSPTCPYKLYTCLDASIHADTARDLKLEPQDVFICLDTALSDLTKMLLADRCNLKVI